MEFSQIKDLFVDQDDFVEVKDETNHFISNLASGSCRYVKAIQKSTNQPFVCKVYNPEILFNERIYETPDQSHETSYHQLKLVREIFNLKRIHHPTIVKFIGFNMYNENITYFNREELSNPNSESLYSPTLFLEYLQNGPLQAYINKGNQNLFNVTKRQICMIGVASALKTLHSNNIIHRGLSPKSIWLDSQFYPKIFDFSTSRAYDPTVDASLTMTEDDKEIYQAPEFRVESGEYTYSSSIDIFSLGRIFYIMATGYEPFKLKGFEVPQSRRVNAELRFPQTMPKGIKELIEACCEHNPYERPTAQQVYNKLTSDFQTYLIDSKVSLIEVQKYIESIESYERIFSNPNSRLRTSISFEVPAVNPSLSQDIQDELISLSDLINSNFTLYSIDESLDLLLKLAKNEQIFESHYLNDVSDFINTASKQGHELANEFLKTVYGDYIVGNDTTEITQDTLTDKNIKTANIPLCVTKIGKKAFKNFKKLERVNIPQSVKVIEEGAFQGCQKLVTVNIPNSINGKSLGKSAFQGCKSLKYIYIPSSVKKINDKTFKSNEKLIKVCLSEGLEEIGKDAFEGCQSLKFIEIPESIKMIENGAFLNCTVLSDMVLKSRNSCIKYNAIPCQVKKFV